MKGDVLGASFFRGAILTRMKGDLLGASFFRGAILYDSIGWQGGGIILHDPSHALVKFEDPKE